MKNNLTNVGCIIDSNKNLNQIFIHDLSRHQHRSFTYGQIDTMSNEVALGLLFLKLKQGSRVGIISKNSAEYIAAYFGILRSGMVAVLIDHKLSDLQIQQIISDADIAVLFLDDESRSSNFSILNTIVIFHRFDEFLKQGKFESVVLGKHDPALILYSSGSNGIPKGVIRSHQSQIASIVRRTSRHKNASQQRHILASSLCHMHGINKIEAVCAEHATIILMSEFDPMKFANAIQDFQITVVTAVPAMLAMVLALRTRIENLDFSSVLSINLGAAPVTEKLTSDLKKIFPNAINKISSRYGMTELGGSLFGRHPQGLQVPDLSVGYPLKDVQLRLSETGVLQVKCESMLTEYLNRPDLNSDMLTPDGYFITKDLFKIDHQGFYYCIGRSDDMFICGGENIFPSSIEIFLESIQDVEIAVVIPVNDDIKGQKPAAFVILNKSSMMTKEQFQQFASHQLSHNLMPRFIWRATKLPQIGPGKFDRNFLRLAAEDLARGRKYIDDFDFLIRF